MITMRLKETRNVIVEEGLFQIIARNNPNSWFSNLDAKNMDLIYYLSHSGEKQISLIYNNLINSSTRDEALNTMANIIFSKYGKNWDKIYGALIIEYYPLENYKLNEKENVGTKVTSSSNVASDTFGFNSVEAVPSNTNKSTATTEGNKLDNERDLERYGMVGNFTRQELLREEIKIRMEENLYDIIFNNADELMCSKYYN